MGANVMTIDIYKKIENGDYETKLPYPKAPLKQCHVCNSSISDVNNITNNGVTSFCSKCGTAVKNEYLSKFLSYKNEKNLYNKDRIRLEQMFKTDALSHCGIGNHIKADIAWNIATDERNNYQEIVDFLEDLSRLMVD